MAAEVIDPVCKMKIDPDTAAGKSVYQGETYYFCSLSCKASFDREPEKYGGKTTTADHGHQH